MTTPESIQETAKRVRMARAGSRMSLRKLSGMVSDAYGTPVSYELLRKIEIGERDAELGILRAVAEVTDTELSWLCVIPGWTQPVVDLRAQTAHNSKPRGVDQHLYLAA